MREREFDEIGDYEEKERERERTVPFRDLIPSRVNRTRVSEFDSLVSKYPNVQCA